MKPIDLIGGIGPESTIDRSMIGAYRRRQPDGSYPQMTERVEQALR